MEQKQRTDEKILGSRMLPNSRPLEIAFSCFSKNEQRSEYYSCIEK